MDNLTHTLTGVALSRAGLDQRVSGATLTLALASNLPDIDIVTGLFGTTTYLEHHRGLTHALPFSPLLAGVFAFTLTRFPGSPRRLLPTFLLSWLGVSLHIVWDLWTVYGTRALLPFDPTWYTWSWTFIIDPVFLLLLAVASFGTGRIRVRHLSRWALGLSLAYIGVRAGAHALAQAQAEDLLGPSYTRVLTSPDPIRLNRWRFVASRPEDFATGFVPAIGESRTKVTVPREVPSALVQRVAAESRAARVFLDFSMFPRLSTRVKGNHTLVIWQDLRFADRRAHGFACEVEVDAHGRIFSERVIF